MIFEKIRKYSLYIVLLVFIVSNAALIGYEFYFKELFISLFLFFTVVFCFYKNYSFIKIINYFVYVDNDKAIKRLSGFISLLAWLFFVLSLFFLNIGFLWFARWFILIFIVCVIICGVLTFYDLEREANVIFSKLKLVFFSGTSVLYFITSAYAASYFLQMSNMDISDSPLLEFGWKLAFFAIYFFMILQPVSYIFFIWAANRLKGHQLMTTFGVIMVTSLALFAMPRWAENFIVVVLDWATSSEWNTSATCGSLNIKSPTEHYFGFNTDKYTVYFSNRDDKWGFEEIKCIKDDKNKDSLERVPVSQSKMPKWFKE